MAKVESFELDHNLVKAPYVRQAGYEQHETGAIVTKFDLRFVQPNQDSLPTGALHTLEHLLAINIRDYIDGVIDLSPMGCRTGFYLICWGEHTTEEIASALEKVLNIVLETTVVPATTAKECGNYRDHSLFGAQEYTKQVLAAGISRDPFVRTV